jgi:phosphatidylserine/phosphatidylglycerophosphate/cardiolipin synthase-like enzyme
MHSRTRTRDLADAVDLAQLAGDVSTLTSLLGAIATRTAVAGTASTSTLTGGDIDADLATAVLEFLDLRGYTEENDDDGETLVLEEGAVVDLFIDARQARRTLNAAKTEDEVGTDADIVCTLPANDPAFADHDAVDFGMRQITSRLLELCGDATDELVITSPFLEADGVDWLLPGLRGALERGVNVTIISRELHPEEPNFEALRSLARNRSSLPGTLALYDYYAADSPDAAPTYTLHSKVLVVDDTQAYIGSANFTKYGFSENLEIGAVITGSQVANLSSVLARVTAGSARPVDIPD